MPTLNDGEFNIGISVCFFYGKLVHIGLAAAGNEFGTSWDDFSEEKEKARVKKTLSWLQKNDLKPGVYDWGTVGCGYDQKASAGGAEIWLFCNQNTFLGLQINLKEFTILRQICINHLSDWNKKAAKTWGFSEEACKQVYLTFPHAEDVNLSKKVMLTLLQNSLNDDVFKNLQRNISLPNKLTKAQIETLHAKLVLSNQLA